MNFEIDITHDPKNNGVQIDTLQKNMENRLTANIDLPTAIKLREQLNKVIKKMKSGKPILKLHNR